MKEKTLND